MVGRSSIRRCYNSVFSWKSKIDRGIGVTGVYNMGQLLTQPTLTATFSSTNDKEDRSPVDRVGAQMPPNSPDLNSLDSFVGGYIQDQFCRNKQELIPELRRAEEDVAATIPAEMLGETAHKVRKCNLGLSGGVQRPF